MPDGTSLPVLTGKAHPMLFNGPMVRALLREIEHPETGKSITRRLITPQPIAHTDGSWRWDAHRGGLASAGGTAIASLIKCAEYHSPFCPGDLIYARESCWLYGQWHLAGTTRTGRRKRTFGLIGKAVVFDNPGGDKMAYWGGGPGFSWRPAMYCPRWASRITLIVTDIRVQRLQDITEEDARREGLSRLSKDDGRMWKWGIPDRDGLPGHDDDGWPWEDWSRDPRQAFPRLWDSTKPKPGTCWEDNPWVLAITFKPILANVDDVLARQPAEVAA